MSDHSDDILISPKVHFPSRTFLFVTWTFLTKYFSEPLKVCIKFRVCFYFWILTKTDIIMSRMNDAGMEDEDMEVKYLFKIQENDL